MCTKSEEEKGVFPTAFDVLHKTFLKINECLWTLFKWNGYNNTCNPPNTLYSFFATPHK